jgi:hypothetical protein
MPLRTTGFPAASRIVFPETCSAPDRVGAAASTDGAVRIATLAATTAQA